MKDSTKELLVICITQVSMWLVTGYVILKGLEITKDASCLLGFVIPMLRTWKYVTPGEESDEE